MKTSLLFAALAMGALSAGACSSPNSTSPDAGADGSSSDSCPTLSPSSQKCQNPKAPPSYATDVAPIIKERCSPCHFPGGLSDKIVDLSSYANVSNAETAMLNELASCEMPPIHGNTEFGIEAGTVPGLSQAQLDTIVDWFYCGDHP
jgi:hypothetical protein